MHIQNMKSFRQLLTMPCPVGFYSCLDHDLDHLFRPGSITSPSVQRDDNGIYATVTWAFLRRSIDWYDM
jgi:hypothetical protein